MVLLLESCVSTKEAVAESQIVSYRFFGTIPVGESALHHAVFMSHYLLCLDLQMLLLKTGRRLEKGQMDMFVPCLFSVNTNLHCIYCVIYNILCIQTH